MVGHVLDEVAVIGVAGEKKVLCLGLVFTSNPQERQPRVRGFQAEYPAERLERRPCSRTCTCPEKLAQVEAENMKLAGE